MINNKNTVNEVEIKYLPKDMTFLIDYLEATSALVKAGELQDNEHTKKLGEILKLYYQKRKALEFLVWSKNAKNDMLKN